MKMRKNFLRVATILVTATLGFSALAQQSVTFNGRNYTCTNQCVITVSGGTWSVTESGGGIVRWTILPKNAEP